MLDLKEAAEKATNTAHSQTLDLIDAQNKAVTTTFENMEKFYGELSQNVSNITDNFKNPLETLSVDDFKVEPMSYDTAFKFGLASFTLKGGFKPLAEAPQLDALTPQATLSLAGKDYTLDELKNITPEMPELSAKTLKPVPASYDSAWIFGMGAYENAFSFEPLENLPQLDAYTPSLSFTKGEASYTPADLKAFFTEQGETVTAQIEGFKDSYTKALNSFTAKAEDAAKEATAEFTKQMNSLMKTLPAFENFDAGSFFSAFAPAAKPAPEAKKCANPTATPKAAVKAPKPTAKVELKPVAAPVVAAVAPIAASVAAPAPAAAKVQVAADTKPSPAPQKKTAAANKP